MAIFEGNAVAIITPFDDKNEIDFNRLTQLVEWHIHEGESAIVVNTIMAEALALSDDERAAIVKTVIDVVNGRIPVIAEIFGMNTQVIVDEILTVEELGIDAVIIAAPYYQAVSQQGLIEFFEYIAEHTNVPLLASNEYNGTGAKLAIETVVELADHPQFIGLYDSGMDMNDTMKVIAQVPSEFAVYCGNDYLLIPMLAAGSRGAISAIANIYPNQVQAIINQVISGDFAAAFEMNQALFPVLETVLADNNPIALKAGLNSRGVAVGDVRLPLVTVAGRAGNKISAVLNEFDGKTE